MVTGVVPMMSGNTRGDCEVIVVGIGGLSMTEIFSVVAEVPLMLVPETVKSYDMFL